MTLDSFALGSWNAEDFVQVANQLLPEFLPEASASQRVREEVNVRLVRHYTSLRTLDEPSKEGKEARYQFRHLLQLLLVRRMLSLGYSATAIEDFPRKQSDAQLLKLLHGQLELTVKPTTNPAMEFLDSVRQRQGLAPPARPHPAPVSARPVRYRRVALDPALELHIREDFQCPSGPALEQLLAAVRQALRDSHQI